MAENILYVYSGSGHCLDMAKTIAKMLGDTDIVLMRSYPAITDARGAKRVGFIFSCMAGGLPGDVESYVKDIQIAPDAYKFAVEQYAGYLGCGLRKLDDIVGLDYWDGISNHSTAIWLMPHVLTFPPTTPELAQERIDRGLSQVEDGVIILMHDQKFNFKTVEALETIIPELLSRGYEFVTVSELFYAKGVTPRTGKDRFIYSNCLQTTNW